MKMIRHEAIRPNLDLERCRKLDQLIDKAFIVIVGRENLLTVVSAIHYMVARIWVLDP